MPFVLLSKKKTEYYACVVKRKGKEWGDSHLPDLNKFSFPKTENMPFLMLCIKLQA